MLEMERWLLGKLQKREEARKSMSSSELCAIAQYIDDSEKVRDLISTVHPNSTINDAVVSWRRAVSSMDKRKRGFINRTLYQIVRYNNESHDINVGRLREMSYGYILNNIKMVGEKGSKFVKDAFPGGEPQGLHT